MKIMIISDIHRNEEILEDVIYIFNKEKIDKMIILGDIEATPRINSILSKIITKLTLIRGNNDYRINDIFLPLPMHDIYVFNYEYNNKTYKCVCAHGERGIPKYEYKENDIVFLGHTHIGAITKYYNIIMANPGSISKPRGGSNKSYIILAENKINLISLEGKNLQTYFLD